MRTNMSTTATKPNAWLNTYQHVAFASALRKIKAKLRRGSRTTIDTSDDTVEEYPETEHPCIEIKQGNKWLPLKMPDGVVFFNNAEDRNRALDSLPSV